MITTTGEYAIRAAVHLAQHEGVPMTSAVIAEATKVPQGYLSKILQQMVKASLINSQRGLNGGFVLALPAAQISLLDVLKAVDASPQRITRCPLGIPGHTKLCGVHRLLDDAMSRMEKEFAEATLEMMRKEVKGIKPLCEVKEAIAALQQK